MSKFVEVALSVSAGSVREVRGRLMLATGRPRVHRVPIADQASTNRLTPSVGLTVAASGRPTHTKAEADPSNGPASEYCAD